MAKPLRRTTEVFTPLACGADTLKEAFDAPAEMGPEAKATIGSITTTLDLALAALSEQDVTLSEAARPAASLTEAQKLVLPGEQTALAASSFSNALLQARASHAAGVEPLETTRRAEGLLSDVTPSLRSFAHEADWARWNRH
ncbi:hypothetical protein JMJ56_30495 [Belnapia sp. T18]|uniref:Phasin protein n=1 Tax=Belnapia arida TaxID=2804533 RepID=A0ABS1UC95_9PROT|nr:hypothetical protein [Belnapia arida]MBL6082308.1 hypothetical protein [Belnapia arida]